MLCWGDVRTVWRLFPEINICGIYIWSLNIFVWFWVLLINRRAPQQSYGRRASNDDDDYGHIRYIYVSQCSSCDMFAAHCSVVALYHSELSELLCRIDINLRLYYGNRPYIYAASCSFHTQPIYIYNSSNLILWKHLDNIYACTLVFV